MSVVMKPRGIYCPSCNSRDVNPDGWMRPTPGVRIRYFKCNKCKGRFKTKERLDGPLKKRNSPDV